MSDRPRHQQFSILASALSPDAREAARAARTTGFNGMLFQPRGGDINLTDLSSTGRREFLHVLSGENQQLVGLTVDVGAKGFGPGADIDRLIDRLERVMEASAELHAPLVCVELGPLPEPPRVEKPKPKIKPEEAGLIIIPTTTFQPEAHPTPAPVEPDPGPREYWTAQLDDTLNTLGARADRYSVTLAFRSALASFAAIEHAIARSNCPWFGIDLDPVAMLRDAWDRHEIFSRLGPLIRHVRGRDALLGADRRTKPAPIGQGATDWSELLTLLDEAGYASWITIDPTELPDRATSAAAALRHLRALQTS